MSQHPQQPDSWHESLSHGHEPDRMRSRWLVVAVVGLVLFAVATHAGLWWFLKAESGDVRDVDRPRSAVSFTTPGEAPPLQPTSLHDRTPREDLAAMHERENALFAAMGWETDPNTHQPTPPDRLVRRVAEEAMARQRRGATRATAVPRTSTTRPVTPVPGVDEGAPR